MNSNPENAVKNIFQFARFVSEAEAKIPNQSAGYADIWWEMEILNASALEEWENSGRPREWEVWVTKYQSEALRLAKALLSEEVPENNIVCDISHFLHFAEKAESEIPH